MVTAEYLNATRITGVVVYAIAALCCWVAFRRREDMALDARLEKWLGIVTTWMVVDILLDVRHHLHGLVVGEAISEGVYEERHGPQKVMLAVLIVLVIAAAVWIVRRFRGMLRETLAAMGGLLTVTLWLMEVISLHGTDGLLYHRAGPVMAIAVGWVIGAGLAGAAVQAGAPLAQGVQQRTALRAGGRSGRKNGH